MCAEQIPCLGEEKCVNDTSGRNYFNSIENGSQHIIVCLCFVWYILSQFIGHLPQIIFSRCTALFLGFFSLSNFLSQVLRKMVGNFDSSTDLRQFGPKIGFKLK